MKPPGFVACGTAFLALFTIAIPATDWSRPFVVGAAVGAAWLFLGVTRRWHPEPSWIDRAAATLGSGWIALAIASYLNVITH